MGVFDIFKKQPAPARPNPEPESSSLSAYSGMRVEVTRENGELLFVAKLDRLRGGRAELYQLTGSDLPPDLEARQKRLEEETLRRIQESEQKKTKKPEQEQPEEQEPEPEPEPPLPPVPVRIRGYHDRERKAVHMKGEITPLPRSAWQVENLVVTEVNNDRAFFRLDTNQDATATTFQGLHPGENPCRLLNISVGGALIRSEVPYQPGDKFLLKVKLLADREPSAMYCQVLRIIEREDAPNEYGCRFLELNDADQDRITENIFAVQRQKRSSSRGSWDI